MIDFKQEFSKLLLVSDGCFMFHLISITPCYDKVHILTIDWVLLLDIHMQIGIPPNIDLICGLNLIF